MQKRIAAFPYRGGKFRLAPKLAGLLPPHKIYVEVFGGAGNLLFAKKPSQIEVYNDANGQLVNLFETIRNHPLLFLERCQNLLYSRELYNAWKNELAKNFEGSDIDSVEAAVRTAYAITSSFTGDPTRGWAFDRSGHHGGSDRWAGIWDKVKFLSQRLQRVDIDHLDFKDCIKNWDSPGTLFFCDPPYWNGESGFYEFTVSDHGDLREILGLIQGKFVLTYDDIKEVRDLYNNFEIRRISTSLSSQKINNGERRRRFPQLLITNFMIP